MADSTPMPAAGQPAPLFEGKTQHGELLRLEDYRGRRVALYFYPKDDTPGCTKQACNLRDHHRDLLEAGIAVIGVSGDAVRSHAAFADKYQLPFPLVSDPDHVILEQYGVWGEKTRFGVSYKGILRTTFLIDEEGVIRAVIKRPQVDEHTGEILELFGQVSG